ncbi:MAG TPA: tetratricopeptide repeat protein [Gemmatimonadota bacterium]|nr:tetratricopeptide repeat protein [Gemmatimonadota bacterium]
MTEPSARLSHRLSVVWFTDLVGYSSLAARDQDEAVALVQRFQAIVEATVLRAEGRVVKFIGDAALLESPSAESALIAATALHREMSERLRTGIHLGDVAVASDGDLYGDGVNGAQRIQTEAQPGQIVVSEDVWRRFRNRPAFVFESLGERHLKGIEPMELFRVVGIEERHESAASATAVRSGSSVAEASRGASRSVAVLPFMNMSPQADNEYFSDGVTEEILTLLTRIEGLKVISRTSVMQYKGTVKPMRQIGEELGVTTILEGSVRHAGQRVRITAQLIDAASDEHVWADRYDRDLEDIFQIQSDVAERIVEALRVRLTNRERARLTERPTESVEAYEAYLKGRHFLSRRTVAAIAQAIERFREAVTTDSGFAQAWIGLADGLILRVIYTEAPVNEVIEEARSAAEKALALDSRLGEAHVSLGLIAQVEGKWEEADRRYRGGIDLSPGYATGYHWYGTFLMSRGRLEEAIAMMGRALELDPLSLPVHTGLGLAHVYAGRVDEGIGIYRRILELDPSYAGAHNNIAQAYLSQTRFEEALASLDALSRLVPDRQPPEVVEELRAGHARAGGPGYWEAMLEEVAPRIDDLGLDAHGDMAQACAQLGRPDEAFDHLKRVVEGHLPQAWQIVMDPLLEPLRSDPRFEEIKRSFGLA